jgi:GNAT superfamily N-acetyltransferase
MLQPSPLLVYNLHTLYPPPRGGAVATAENPILRPQVVDLYTVKPAELEALWQHEAQWWREQLRWDISDNVAALRRVLARGGVAGKAVRIGPETVGYAYYGMVDRLAMIAGPVLAPEWSNAAVGEPLLQEIVDAVRRQGVWRIESQCVATDGSWRCPAFEHAGFRTYWREFMRFDLSQTPEPISPPALVHLESWRGASLPAAAAIMQAAYEGSIDVEINARYRTVDGCREALEQLLNQGGCGMFVATASTIACHKGQSIGFVLVTESAPRQGHLAQVAVHPDYQRQGVGRFLLSHSLAQLAALQFDTLSLIVSRANTGALGLYQAMGWQAVLAFPAFAWERSVGAREIASTA